MSGKTSKPKTNKKAQKIDSDYEQDSQNDSFEEEVRHLEAMIEEEAELEKSRKNPPKRKNLNGSSLVNIKDHEIKEAKEVNPKSKKRKADMAVVPDIDPEPKNKTVWGCAESVCLKLLTVGSPPIGKNSAGKEIFIENFEITFNNHLALAAALNKELDWTDLNHHVYTQKEVRHKLDTALFTNLKNVPAKIQEVPKKSAPLFDNCMIKLS